MVLSYPLPDFRRFSWKKSTDSLAGSMIVPDFSFEWYDLIDIAIVAFIIYRVILLMKGAVAVRLLLALAAVLLSYFFAQLSGLKTLSWLLDRFLGSIVLVLILVFQHDIRRSLLTFGRRRANVSQEPGEEDEVIHELVTAVMSLAEKRIGALIVIEREMPVLNYVQIGTEIDAKVTSELISSIFLPYSPIHDGAVIIQKGKLTKAGCFLPLTQGHDISKSLGTRHRAAIGLSELVDALVVVVSEETGGTSLVMGGKIMPVPDMTTLRKLLKKHLDQQRSG